MTIDFAYRLSSDLGSINFLVEFFRWRRLDKAENNVRRRWHLQKRQTELFHLLLVIDGLMISWDEVDSREANRRKQAYEHLQQLKKQCEEAYERKKVVPRAGSENLLAEEVIKPQRLRTAASGRNAQPTQATNEQYYEQARHADNASITQTVDILALVHDLKNQMVAEQLRTRQLERQISSQQETILKLNARVYDLEQQPLEAVLSLPDDGGRKSVVPVEDIRYCRHRLDLMKHDFTQSTGQIFRRLQDLERDQGNVISLRTVVNEHTLAIDALNRDIQERHDLFQRKMDRQSTEIRQRIESEEHAREAFEKNIDSFHQKIKEVMAVKEHQIAEVVNQVRDVWQSSNEKEIRSLGRKIDTALQNVHHLDALVKEEFMRSQTQLDEKVADLHLQIKEEQRARDHQGRSIQREIEMVATSLQLKTDEAISSLASIVAGVGRGKQPVTIDQVHSRLKEIEHALAQQETRIRSDVITAVSRIIDITPKAAVESKKGNKSAATESLMSFEVSVAQLKRRQQELETSVTDQFQKMMKSVLDTRVELDNQQDEIRKMRNSAEIPSTTLSLDLQTKLENAKNDMLSQLSDYKTQLERSIRLVHVELEDFVRRADMDKLKRDLDTLVDGKTRAAKERVLKNVDEIQQEYMGLQNKFTDHLINFTRLETRIDQQQRNSNSGSVNALKEEVQKLAVQKLPANAGAVDGLKYAELKQQLDILKRRVDALDSEEEIDWKEQIQDRLAAIEHLLRVYFNTAESGDEQSNQEDVDDTLYKEVDIGEDRQINPVPNDDESDVGIDESETSAPNPSDQYEILSDAEVEDSGRHLWQVEEESDSDTHLQPKHDRPQTRGEKVKMSSYEMVTEPSSPSQAQSTSLQTLQKKADVKRHVINEVTEEEQYLEDMNRLNKEASKLLESDNDADVDDVSDTKRRGSRQTMAVKDVAAMKRDILKRTNQQASSMEGVFDGVQGKSKTPWRPFNPSM